MLSAEVKNAMARKQDWIKLLPKDPREFLLESKESFTVYRTLIDLLELTLDQPDVEQARNQMLKDPLVDRLLNNLSDWERDIVTAHNKPDYLPNQLWLLLDWGVKPEDDKRMEVAIKQILA
ncbi:MAG: hypothetical protein ACFE8P_09690, partial [Promethearchaeota archaeon]